MFVQDTLGEKADYQAVCLFIGMTELWKCPIDLIAPVDYLFDDYEGDASSLYGGGFSYTRCVPSSRRSYVSLQEALKTPYDLMVWGTITRSKTLFRETFDRLPKERRWLVCGHDVGKPEAKVKEWKSQGTVFVREFEKEYNNQRFANLLSRTFQVK